MDEIHQDTKTLPAPPEGTGMLELAHDQIRAANAEKESALENLGKVAVGKPHSIDESTGLVLSERDAQRELAHRSLHGRSSDEVGTQISRG